MAAGPMNALRMYKDVPRLFDAWGHRQQLPECGFETPVVESIAVDCAQGLAASLTWTGRVGVSTIRQTISVQVGSPVVHL